MGTSSSAPAVEAATDTKIQLNSVEITSQIPTEHPVTTNAAKLPPEGCPMHQKLNTEQNDNASQCPMREGNAKDHQAQVQYDYPSECPMRAANINANKENNDEINPLNMMPAPNQQPSPGQPFPLSTERELSSISRAGTEGHWVYPSQQMFWNAMLRKGWRWEKDDLKPSDMDNIIKMHNMNNERAWEEVLKWEAFHAHECSEPKLLKFGGKATEFSPRARIRSWFGYDLPFDRHDWIVDRCGKEVRYIIDYYDIGDPEAYKKGDFVHMDVRPAFDSFEAVLDRSRVAMLRWAVNLRAWSRNVFGSQQSANDD